MPRNDMLRGAVAALVVTAVLGSLLVISLRGGDDPVPSTALVRPSPAALPTITATSTPVPSPEATTKAGDPDDAPVLNSAPDTGVCVPAPVEWLLVSDIDPVTWRPPPLPSACIPDEWPLRTWRPDEPIVAGTTGRPWVLVHGAPINGPPDESVMSDIVQILHSYEQWRSAMTASSAQLDYAVAAPWMTGRIDVIVGEWLAEMQSMHAERPFDITEIQYRDEVLVVDMRGVVASLYVWRRGFADSYRYRDTGELLFPEDRVVDIGAWMESWERSPDFSDRWLIEWSQPVGFFNDPRDVALPVVPHFDVLIPYHDFYFALALEEFEISGWSQWW